MAAFPTHTGASPGHPNLRQASRASRVRGERGERIRRGDGREPCRKRRDFAVRLYEARELDRAERSLRFCFDLLKIPEKPRAAKKKAGPSMEEVQAQAAREVEQAVKLTANVENGLEIYRGCAREMSRCRFSVPRRRARRA